MAPSASDIARLRRMTNEPTADTYSDDLLSDYLSAWPLVDKNGHSPDNGTSWIEAYDLHAAAADVWDEKAAALFSKHDFSADGANFSSNQMYDNAKAEAKRHRAMQKAQVKRNIPVRSVATYFPEYKNPVFDEDENPDWVDNIV